MNTVKFLMEKKVNVMCSLYTIKGQLELLVIDLNSLRYFQSETIVLIVVLLFLIYCI